jgi:succinate dehydrogenase / fumarate reductase cytochrome b subunit
LQTLGANHPRYNTLFHRIALVVALIIAIGNISFPVAVLTGMVR